MTGGESQLPAGAGERDAADETPSPQHPLELALRHGARYNGLRGVAIDRRLLLYVPLDLCEREMVVPLSVGDSVVEVAAAGPDPDLSIVRERFPQLAVELVFAPSERIAALHAELRAAG